MTLNLEPIKQPYFSCITPLGILTIDEVDEKSITICLEDKFNMRVVSSIKDNIILNYNGDMINFETTAILYQ